MSEILWEQQQTTLQSLCFWKYLIKLKRVSELENKACALFKRHTILWIYIYIYIYIYITRILVIVFWNGKIVISQFYMTKTEYSWWYYWITCMSRTMTKSTKWHVCPAKTQISLGIRPVWSESSLSAWRSHMSLTIIRERMPRLIWVFARRTCHFVGFVMLRLVWYKQRSNQW